MNGALKSAIFNPQSRVFNLRAALFHSTPVLERKRRNHGHTSRSHHISDFCSKRFRRTQSKQSIFHNISAFADHIIQMLDSSYEDNTGRRNSSSNYGYNFWDHHHWRSRNKQNSRSRVEEDYEFEEESESPELDMASHRQALGLSASGPLKLEDVKIAYRACALKWHPDRHQGSSKVVAEEKFKFCSAAYQSLCDKLAVD